MDKMIIASITIFGLMAISFGAPLYEEYGKTITGPNINTKTRRSITKRNSGDSFTATETAKSSISKPAVTFVKSEETIKAVEGSSLYITCETKMPVKECQWSYHQLNEAKQSTLESVIFPAFGNDNTNCTFKLEDVSRQKDGLWTCGARANGDTFIQSSPVRLLISEDAVEFSEYLTDIHIKRNTSVFLRCQTTSAVDQCRWSLKPVNSISKVAFEPFAAIGDKRDCSFTLKNARDEDEGLWSCGAKRKGQKEYTYAPSVKLNIIKDFIPS